MKLSNAIQETARLGSELKETGIEKLCISIELQDESEVG